MPVLALKSLSSLDDIEKKVGIDKNWIKITREIQYPFPKNRLIIKKELEKLYKIRFEEDSTPNKNSKYYLRLFEVHRCQSRSNIRRTENIKTPDR